MSVPASGPISLEGLAQESLHGTYGTGTISNPISLLNLITGGVVSGGHDYRIINTLSPSRPDAIASHAISEWYSYNNPICQSVDLFRNCDGGRSTTYYTAMAIDVFSHPLYTDSSCTTFAPRRLYSNGSHYSNWDDVTGLWGLTYICP